MEAFTEKHRAQKFDFSFGWLKLQSIRGIVMERNECHSMSTRVVTIPCHTVRAENFQSIAFHFHTGIKWIFFRSNLMQSLVPPQKSIATGLGVSTVSIDWEAQSSLKTHNIMNHCCRPVGLFRIVSGEFHLFILRVLLLLQPPPLLPKRQRHSSLANECPDMVKWAFKYLLLFCAHGECPHRRTHKIFMVIKVECLFLFACLALSVFRAMFGVSWLPFSWPALLVFYPYFGISAFKILTNPEFEWDLRRSCLHIVRLMKNSMRMFYCVRAPSFAVHHTYQYWLWLVWREATE